MAKRILIILVILVASMVSYAGITLPPYKLYTLRDGLPQMQIWSMFQDSRGYMWFGTKGGLSRFDGHNFVNFTEKDGLPENQIEQIAEDYSGKIWIVTRRGLSVYDGKSIATYPRSVISLKIAPTPDGKIWYFGQDLKNVLLFGYLENGKYISVVNDYPEFQAPYYDICYSGLRKSLLISSGHQLFELANKKLKLLKTVPYILRIQRDGEEITFQQWDAQNHIKLYEFRNDSLMQVAEVVDGKIVGPNRAKLVHRILWSGIYHQMIVVDKYHIETKDFPDQYLNVCITDRDKHLWLGTEEGAVQCYAGGFETYSRETPPLI